MKRIGVLTGGGDVPGLNPCIKTIVYRAIDEGYEVVGIRKGWGGLLYCNPEDPESVAEYILPLDKRRVRTIDRTGGTFLHTSRTNPGKVRASEVPAFLKDKTHPDDKGPFDFTPHVLQVLDKLDVGTLVPIGGDDTLSYAERLHREGVHIAAIPKTWTNVLAPMHRLPRLSRAAWNSSTGRAPARQPRAPRRGGIVRAQLG
jgi:6-phosphofructokinase 1